VCGGRTTAARPLSGAPRDYRPVTTGPPKRNSCTTSRACLRHASAGPQPAQKTGPGPLGTANLSVSHHVAYQIGNRDSYQDGVVLVPGDIGRDEAQQAIDDARASIGSLNAAFGAEDALDQLRGLAGAGLEQLFRKYVELMAPGLDVDGWDAGRLYQEIVRLAMTDPDHVLRVAHELWGEFRSPPE
jgi:hypothetical protein